MADSEVIFVNPFAVSAQQQGWRGVGLPNKDQSSRRKAYTVLENEFILVTALVVLPGERSIRHYHETGELNISYIGENRPVIRWNPPGVLHGGPVEAEKAAQLDLQVRETLNRVQGKDPDISTVLSEILQKQVNIEAQLAELTKPVPHLRVAIDVLFPPFRTIIDDPAYQGNPVITGQWYD